MCNIVNSPCKICGKDLPLHLGDYKTAPHEVECYCEEHIPDNNVRVFTLIEDDYFVVWKIDHPKGWKMGIRSLTDNAKECEECNYPNVYADYEIIPR